MDSISVDALSAVIAQAVAGEAGKSTWAALLALSRRAFKRSHAARGALERVATGDHQAATEAAEHLVARAKLDPAVAEALREWMGDALAQVGAVTNIVSAEARIQGNLVQARDIRGPITFH